MNVFTASKGLNFYILFAITAAGVVPCGGSKRSPRTSSIVQIIFSFRSFEISKAMFKIFDPVLECVFDLDVSCKLFEITELT